MYKRFNNDDIVDRQAQELVTSTWSDNTNNLQVAYTSSAQASFSTATSSGQFYINVYHLPLTNSGAEVQYSISYGHRMGSGSPDFTNDTGSFGNSAAKVIYSQYRQLAFNDEATNFMFGTHIPDDIIVININRSRYKQRLTLGSLNLQISGSSLGVQGNSDYGACASDGTNCGNGTIHLTDDSVSNNSAYANSNLGPVYNIVSGSNGVMSGSKTNQLILNGSGSTYGNYYPEAGLIILNCDAFGGALVPTASSNFTTHGNGANHVRFLHHIDTANQFIVDTTEEINSQFYFIRARNSQFNYTNNESFVDASKNIAVETNKLNPKVFITTVGLYNDAFELIAVAKLSQPVAKDFTKEALIRVKLDY
jgi:hypothetical protein